MRVLFLIRSLELGGAEGQMALLARGLKARGHEVWVASFYAQGPLAAGLTAAGVEVIPLGKRGRWDWAGFFARLGREIKTRRPQVLYSFLDTPNLAAAMLRPRFPHLKVVWGVRASFMDLSRFGFFPAAMNRLTVLASPLASGIVVNSRAALDFHTGRGMPLRLVKVIENGVDTARFAPGEEGRAEVRREWGVGPDELLVGLAGRLDPMKDHPNFLKAAAIMAEAREDARFVCVGGGPTDYARRLKDMAASLGLAGRVVWAGERGDMPRAYRALDLAVSASYGESFPNAVAEAMASGLPVVVTRVGDSARAVAEADLAVPARDAEALAKACLAVLDIAAGERTALGLRLRERVVRRFSLEAMVAATERYLSWLLRAPALRSQPTRPE